MTATVAYTLGGRSGFLFLGPEQVAHAFGRFHPECLGVSALAAAKPSSKVSKVSKGSESLNFKGVRVVESRSGLFNDSDPFDPRLLVRPTADAEYAERAEERRKQQKAVVVLLRI